jgi:hypothetical protein
MLSIAAVGCPIADKPSSVERSIVGNIGRCPLGPTAVELVLAVVCLILTN